MMPADLCGLMPAEPGEAAGLGLFPGTLPAPRDGVGEIVTPWRVSEYIDQLEAAMVALNVAVHSGPVYESFDYVGWLAFFFSWEQYRAQVGIVDEWVNPGETFNRVEQYHNDYRTWHKRAADAHIVQQNSDPMPKPQPYQNNPNGGVLDGLGDVLGDVVVIAGIVAAGYFINSVRSR